MMLTIILNPYDDDGCKNELYIEKRKWKQMNEMIMTIILNPYDDDGYEDELYIEKRK